MIGEGCITLIDVKNGYSARSFFVAKMHRAMLPPIADRIASELGFVPLKSVPLSACSTKEQPCRLLRGTGRR